MKRALLISAVAVCFLVLSVPASGDAVAVAKPATQTVPINGTAADFDGSDSYAEAPECPIDEWAWDFDGDGEDDYVEYSGPSGDGITTHVYDQAGIFTAKLTVTDAMQRTDDDTQEVKVRLTVSSGELTASSVEVQWDNANNADQFTKYQVHKGTSPGFGLNPSNKVAEITNMATTSYTVTGLEPNTTYYFKVKLVVTAGNVISNELEQATTGGPHGIKYRFDKAGNLTRVLYTDDGGSTWQTTDYRYSAVYALTRVTFPDSKAISYFYDDAGQRTRMIDPASNVLSYLYRCLCQLFSEACLVL